MWRSLCSDFSVSSNPFKHETIIILFLEHFLNCLSSCKFSLVSWVHSYFCLTTFTLYLQEYQLKFTDSTKSIYGCSKFSVCHLNCPFCVPSSLEMEKKNYKKHVFPVEQSLPLVCVAYQNSRRLISSWNRSVILLTFILFIIFTCLLLGLSADFKLDYFRCNYINVHKNKFKKF